VIVEGYKTVLAGEGENRVWALARGDGSLVTFGVQLGPISKPALVERIGRAIAEDVNQRRRST
jgi:hypothetical protein